MGQQLGQNSGKAQQQSGAQPKLRAGKPREWYGKLMREEPGFERKDALGPSINAARMNQNIYELILDGNIPTFKKNDYGKLHPDDLQLLICAYLVYDKPGDAYNALKARDMNILEKQGNRQLNDTDFVNGAARKMTTSNVITAFRDMIDLKKMEEPLLHLAKKGMCVPWWAGKFAKKIELQKVKGAIKEYRKTARHWRAYDVFNEIMEGGKTGGFLLAAFVGLPLGLGKGDEILHWGWFGSWMGCFYGSAIIGGVVGAAYEAVKASIVAIRDAWRDKTRMKESWLGCREEKGDK